MIRAGSQILHCSNPLNFDTYKGCSHGCEYCFAKRKNDIAKIKNGGGWKSFANWIKGERNEFTKWCSLELPIHIGGLSDPYQPIEKTENRTRKVLEYVYETRPDYPLIISTKGTEILMKDLDLISKMNVAIQISMVSPDFDNIEPKAPTYNERLNSLEKISNNCKRLLIRIQPYILESKKHILSILQEYKDRGVHGIIIEGMKWRSMKDGLVKVGGDCCYPRDKLITDFNEIKRECHKVGLRFYCAENRLRDMSDSLNCCGVDGLNGFIEQKYNITHHLFGNKEIDKNMCEIGSAACFAVIEQTGQFYKGLELMSFKECMDLCCSDYNYINVLLQKK